MHVCRRKTYGISFEPMVFQGGFLHTGDLSHFQPRPEGGFWNVRCSGWIMPPPSRDFFTFLSQVSRRVNTLDPPATPTPPLHSIHTTPHHNPPPPPFATTTIYCNTSRHRRRDNFGLAQAKLFDAYFKFSLLCLAVAGFTAAALVSVSTSTSSDGDEGGKLGAAPFLVAVTTVVLNLVFFSPQTTITMMERRRVCRELGVERTSQDPQVCMIGSGSDTGLCGLCALLSMHRPR